MSAEKSLDENLAFIVEQARGLVQGRGVPGFGRRTRRASGRSDGFRLRTDEFRNLHIPAGKGLSSAVLRVGAGVIIPDYFDFPDVVRVPEVDAAARAEGVVSGIAAPVQMAPQWLGVLYVFNRQRCSWSQADLDTLILLGNLAAVEIVRQRAEAALRRSEVLYRAVFEYTGAATACWTRHADSPGQQSIRGAHRLFDAWKWRAGTSGWTMCPGGSGADGGIPKQRSADPAAAPHSYEFRWWTRPPPA
jgi:hypothetical protein